MAKTRDRVFDAAGNVKPYVERAINDEKLREEVMSAFATARELYDELIGDRRPATVAARVATDTEVREKLRDAIDDLRAAADRLQGKRERSGRGATLLIAGIAIGILFNPVTGPETRRWLKELIGGSDEFSGNGYGPSSGNGNN
jgi:hypothetical protein